MTGTGLTLFAYGTLLVPEVMHAVTGRKLSSVDAVLKDYNRCSIKNEIFPAIVAQAGTSVTGRFYTGLDRNTLKILDVFEDVIYARCNKKVMTANNVFVDAQVYVISDEYHHLLSDVPWSPEEFKQHHLEQYIKKCRRFLVKYNREHGDRNSD